MKVSINEKVSGIVKDNFDLKNKVIAEIIKDDPTEDKDKILEENTINGQRNVRDN